MDDLAKLNSDQPSELDAAQSTLIRSNPVCVPSIMTDFVCGTSTSAPKSSTQIFFSDVSIKSPRRLLRRFPANLILARFDTEFPLINLMPTGSERFAHIQAFRHSAEFVPIAKQRQGQRYRLRLPDAPRQIGQAFAEDIVLRQ